MEKTRILDWTVEINKQKIIEYYKDMPYVTELCDCKDCVNFENACKFISDDIKELFNKLGIDIEKSQELFHCMDNDDGTSLYWAFCDIIGNIIEGTDCMVHNYIPENKEKGTAEILISRPILIPYREGFKIGFNRRQDLEYRGEKYKAICLQFEGVLKRTI